MSSLRRINSSRANGARSRGPIAPEGKEGASTNALSHGLLAKYLALEKEFNEGFDDEEMVAASWRMRYAWAIETRLMSKAIRHQPHGDEAERIANAFSQLAASPQLKLLHRYKARLHRIYERAFDDLVMLSTPADLPDDPTPISEQCAPVAQVPGSGGLPTQPPAPDLSDPAQTGRACGVGKRPPGPLSGELPAAPSEDAAEL